MIPARALRCRRTYRLQLQARVWATALSTITRSSTTCTSSKSFDTFTVRTTGSCSAAWSGGAGGSSRRRYGPAGDAVRPILSKTTSMAAAGGTALGAAPSIPKVDTATNTNTTMTSSSALWDEIVSVYNAAQASGACSKTDTQVEVLRDPSIGVDFVLRVATALKAKPQGPPTAQQAPGAAAPLPAWRNPFLPPEPELFVRHLGSEHSLVLNKFNVVQHHVLCITREFRSQAEPLYGNDLAAALEVVRAMPSGGVAFYNCGPNSGRSQPHKHLQVVPLPFTDSQAATPPLEPLLDEAALEAGGVAAPLQPLELRRLPYRCYVTLLPDSPSPEQLQSAFSTLLQLSYPGYVYEPSPLLSEGPPQDAATAVAVAAGTVSYNVLLTRAWIMLIPRSAERCGPLALNSLAFAGTMLVRSEDELDYVRQTGPAEILARIGVPW